MDASSVEANKPVLQDPPGNEKTHSFSPAATTLHPPKSFVPGGTQLEDRAVKKLSEASDNSKDLSRFRTVIKWILDKLVEWRWLSATSAKNLLTKFLIEIDNELAKSDPDSVDTPISTDTIPEEITSSSSERQSTKAEGTLESSQESSEITSKDIQGVSDKPEVGNAAPVQPEDPSPEQSIPEEITPPPSESHSTVDDEHAEFNPAVLHEDSSPEQSILPNNPPTEQSIPVITEGLTKDLTEVAQAYPTAATEASQVARPAVAGLPPMASICERAIEHYNKILPKYKDVVVVHEGRRKKWVDLTPEQQLAMVKKGARGGWLKHVKDWTPSDWTSHYCSPQRVLGIHPGGKAEMHGVKHCLRACLVAEATARVYRGLFKEFENISEEDIRLAAAAAAYHDSGRQGEEVDVFDDLSALQAREDLAKMGVSCERCERCGNAISHKDAQVLGKDPIAILLHEADCLEIQRIRTFTYDPSFLDACQRNGSGGLILTPRDGVTQGQIDEAIQDLVSKTKALISKTEGNEDITESYGEYRKAAEQIGLIKPIATSLDFIAEFNKLGICPSDPAKQTKLNDLIEKLHAKSPEMLAGILNNCQWLVGKAKPEFIFSVAVESMQMELADIFDQNGFNALPKGIQPAQYIMYGNAATRYYSLLDDDSNNVIKETYKKFKSWLEARKDLPVTEEKMCASLSRGMQQPQNSWEMYSLMWLQWQARGGGVCSPGTFSVRQAVLDTTLETKPFITEELKDALAESRNSHEYEKCYSLVSDVSLAPYIPISYAYTQLLMRHATFPGHDKGPPPTLLAIRKVPAAVFENLTGKTHNAEDTGKEVFSYTTDRALPAESWGTVSQVYTPRLNYGESAIYGHVPAYSVITSVFAHNYEGPNAKAKGIIDYDMWGSCQKELVVLPFSDIEVTIEPNFDQKRYAEEIMFPAMEKQYGSDHDAIGNARRHWRLKG